jgi:signal transduction histidine kinase
LSDNKSVEFEEISLAFKQILATDNTERLFDLFDTTIAVLDMDGNILIGKKWQKICTDFHRVNADSCQKCIESDTQLANELEEGKNYTVYRCKNGMVDCASPIIIEGHHIANVYVGQFLFEEPDLSFFRANAKKYGFDEKAYMAALSDVPIIDEESQVALNYLTEISKFISVMAIEKIRAMKLEKNYQEELNKKLNEEIEKNRKKEEIMIAQSRHAAMGEMIGMIAHQWRQPLQIINMNVNNTLADIDFEEITMENLQVNSKSILTQTEHLTKTIDDFKNFFSPNQKKEDIPILSVIEEANSIIGPSLINSSIVLNISCSSDIKASIYKRELVQVILNLINNSKHAISNNIENRHIDIEVSKEDNWILLKVSDNGSGISDENIGKIFEPYFTTKGVSSGTGLGLYISKTIIETHFNGAIKAYNIDGGACFEIKIPKE